MRLKIVHFDAEECPRTAMDHFRSDIIQHIFCIMKSNLAFSYPSAATFKDVVGNLVFQSSI